jgi:hypothetical protein
MAVLVTAIHADPLPLGLKTCCVGAALGTAGTSPAMTAGRPATSRALVLGDQIQLPCLLELVLLVGADSVPG